MTRLFLTLVFSVCIILPAGAATVDGLNIHSTSTGSGAAIVFVHGWTCDLSSWNDQVAAFAGDYQVLTLDLPGHGLSDTPAPENFSMAQFARAVEAVRAEAGADKIVLVGHSMGAVVIRQYALMYPEHVAGLVGVDGPLDMRTFPEREAIFPAKLTLEARENIIRGMFVDATPEALQEHILSMMLAVPESSAEGAISATFDPAIRNAEIIHAPTLAVVAGTGRMPDVAFTRQIIPDFNVTQVAGTGHFLMMEKPAQFNRILSGFLDDIDFH